LLKRIFLSILITVGIIFAFLTQISLKDLYTLLKSTDLFWVLLGSASYFLAILFRAFRYKWLIHSKNLPLSEVFRISAFYNLSIMVFPSKIGELSYPYLLNKISGMSMTEGLASLIASRVYDFFIILLIFLLASIGFQTFFKIDLILIILLSGILFGLILLVFFHMSSLLGWFSNVLGRVSNWSVCKNWKSLQWGQREIRNIAEDFYAIKAKRTYFQVSLVSLFSWVMILWTFYAFLRGFGIDISFPNVVFASTLAIITSALPISGLGNWGMLEVGWAAGFLMVGLSKEEAIASGFGVHIMVFAICIVISFICWITLTCLPYPPDAGDRQRR
jgi:uncharacterized protein (TIRG00374 family)